jgi:hypothetical protein
LIFYRRRACRGSQILHNILRPFWISDKPGRTHTSDAVAPRTKAKMILAEWNFRFSLLFEHDLFRKPVSTFRDHAARRKA